MPYFSRQIVASLAEGDVEADGAFKGMWNFQDVLWRTKLILEPGKSQGGKFLLATATTVTLPLPLNYDSAQPLFVLISVNGLVKIAATSTTPVVSTFLCNGSASEQAVTCFTEYATSVTINNTTGAGVFIEYSMVELPDLDETTSYREGTIVRGIT